MRRLALAAAMALAAGSAEACQCYNFSPAEIVQRADLVFEGTVDVVSRVGAQSQVTISISRLDKGPRLTSVTLLTPASPAACGVSFAPRQRVTVAAKRDGGVWRTNLCMALALRPLPFIPSR